MPRKAKPKIGAVAWTDLTMKPAAKVRDFYSAVVGWKAIEMDMGSYSDYGMNQPYSVPVTWPSLRPWCES